MKGATPPQLFSGFTLGSAFVVFVIAATGHRVPVSNATFTFIMAAATAFSTMVRIVRR